MAALQAELQVVTHSKATLEKELQEVITLTSTELEDYQEKVLELEDEVGSPEFYLQHTVQSGNYYDYLHFLPPTASRVQMLQKANPKVRRCQQKVGA